MPHDTLSDLEENVSSLYDQYQGALAAYITVLQSSLEEEQRARWKAEQDAQHYEEKCGALQLQVEQLSGALKVATGADFGDGSWLDETDY